MLNSMPKIAILGGTFNPIHLGHLLIAETALDQLAIDQIIWVPAYRPRHKPLTELANFQHRLEMVKLATASHAQFTVSALEQHQLGLSYAADTFSALKALDAASRWYWIIGLDAFLLLPQWRRRQEWVAECEWLVAPRLGGEVPRALCEKVAEKLLEEAILLQWQLLEMPLVGISSGLIRQYCQEGRSIRYLVSDPVRRYILAQELYCPTN